MTVLVRICTRKKEKVTTIGPLGEELDGVQDLRSVSTRAYERRGGYRLTKLGLRKVVPLLPDAALIEMVFVPVVRVPAGMVKS